MGDGDVAVAVVCGGTGIVAAAVGFAEVEDGPVIFTFGGVFRPGIDVLDYIVEHLDVVVAAVVGIYLAVVGEAEAADGYVADALGKGDASGDVGFGEAGLGRRVLGVGSVPAQAVLVVAIEVYAAGGDGDVAPLAIQMEESLEVVYETACDVHDDFQKQLNKQAESSCYTTGVVSVRQA